MSAQILELIVLGIIAFFLIQRLLSILGKKPENDPLSSKSFFGARKSTLKDVTNTTEETSSTDTITSPTHSLIDEKLIIKANRKEIEDGLKTIQKIIDFNPKNFLKSAKMAFKMIIDAGISNDEQSLSELVDKRYIQHLQSILGTYGKLAKMDNLEAYISEIYSFGNNVFVKILFTGKNITTKTTTLNEAWTFVKNASMPGPSWNLTNIEKPH